MRHRSGTQSRPGSKEHKADVRRCAEWTADELRRIGLQNVKLIDTPGNPVNYFYIPNTGKARRALGLRELTTLDEGLVVYAEYLRSSLRLV